MTNSISSVANTVLFAEAQELPAGFYYELEQVGIYIYGSLTPLYRIGVVRLSDGSIIWGNPFYPSDQYPDAQSMVTTEANNSYDNWNEYFSSDEMTIASQALIGF